MKLIILALLLTSCSVSRESKNCELECIDCKSVKFKCSGESGEIDIINKAVL